MSKTRLIECPECGFFFLAREDALCPQCRAKITPKQRKPQEAAENKMVENAPEDKG